MKSGRDHCAPLRRAGSLRSRALCAPGRGGGWAGASVPRPCCLHGLCRACPGPVHGVVAAACWANRRLGVQWGLEDRVPCGSSRPWEVPRSLGPGPHLPGFCRLDPQRLLRVSSVTFGAPPSPRTSRQMAEHPWARPAWEGGWGQPRRPLERVGLQQPPSTAGAKGMGRSLGEGSQRPKQKAGASVDLASQKRW